MSTELEYELGRALGIPVQGADPALAYLGHQERRARAVRARRRPAPARRRARPQPRRRRRRDRAPARASGRGSRRSWSSSTPASPARATRSSSCAGSRAPGARTELRADRRARRRDAPAGRRRLAQRLPRAARARRRSSRSGSSARELRSPSVQLELAPAEARIVSTHDQILDGDGYIGCRFPAEPAYAGAITDAARRVGALLAEAGAIGRAAIDFVVARDAAGDWRAYAIELNLRKGGTTHPLAALELLSGGAYDPESATFRAACGSPRHYVATDHLESPRLRALGHSGLLSIGPAAGSGRLRRRLPHAQCPGRTRPRRA